MHRLGSASSWLVALYPRPWRDRYGPELRALLEEEPATASVVLDVLRGALDAHTVEVRPLETHASPLPAGGIPMRSRSMAATSVVALLLVLPAVTLLTAALVRTLQPTAHEPAHTAQVIFDAFAALPAGSLWVLIGLLPLVGLLLSGFVAWQSIASDPGAREDLQAFVDGLRRVVHQPVIVVAGLAFAASAGVLAFAIVHAVAG